MAIWVKVEMGWDQVLGRALEHPQRGRMNGQTHLAICEMLSVGQT